MFIFNPTMYKSMYKSIRAKVNGTLGNVLFRAHLVDQSI